MGPLSVKLEEKAPRWIHQNSTENEFEFLRNNDSSIDNNNSMNISTIDPNSTDTNSSVSPSFLGNSSNHFNIACANARSTL